MTLRHRTTLRSAATAGILGLTATSAVVLGAATPASAATIDFDCTVPVIGAKTFGVDVSTNAPASVPAGTTFAPVVTSVMTVPADLADTMRLFFHPTAIGGTVHATTVVDGKPVATTITIPRTAVPASGAIVLRGTGRLPAIAAGAQGASHTIAAGNQAVGMTLFQGTTGSPFDIPCTPASGQSTTVSTVAVGAPLAPSTTKVKAAYQAKKHQAKVTATVTAGKPATGVVTFTLKRGAKTLKTVRVALAGGKAATTFKKLRKGKHTVVASYGGSGTVRASSGTAKIKVR